MLVVVLLIMRMSRFDAAQRLLLCIFFVASFLYILSSFSRATFKPVYMRNGRRLRVLLAEPTIHVKHQGVQPLADCSSHEEFNLLHSDTVLMEHNMLPTCFL